MLIFATREEWRAAIAKLDREMKIIGPEGSTDPDDTPDLGDYEDGLKPIRSKIGPMGPELFENDVDLGDKAVIERGYGSDFIEELFDEISRVTKKQPEAE